MRQRIGIARALYLKPKLIVLDEATSSLGGKAESDIFNAIISLKGEVTVILINHRLSTVMNADKIFYMEEGKILTVGNFDQIRKQIPNFDSQASLIGI
jgi:ABC-type multidrug transport system fused ATPase/permease subunit